MYIYVENIMLKAEHSPPIIAPISSDDSAQSPSVQVGLKGPFLDSHEYNELVGRTR